MNTEKLLENIKKDIELYKRLERQVWVNLTDVVDDTLVHAIDDNYYN